ncbi:MAG: dTDP-glucose 4,6-dehydratase, partial [Chloroflexia bacterium]|nr:dTDP-glucose 4,6-dehydratase [Chloroflexia bacterium]
MRNLLITGGAGFIGSNFVRYILHKYPDYRVVVYDKLTYAGNLENLKDVAADFAGRYAFIQGDICEGVGVRKVVVEQGIDTIVNFAAESHVDRSILEPDAFIRTDIYGTYVLLETAKEFHLARMLQVSTDEIYGSIAEGYFSEDDPACPNSPYAASKAGAEHLARAYYVTYGVPTLITRGSNTFGPYQYPEKVTPLFITNAIDNAPLPLYGDGQQVRDWLYVLDHCAGIDLVLHKGQVGEAYNIAGENERRNREITERILDLVGKPRSLVRHVSDRPGHDRRYAL